MIQKPVKVREYQMKLKKKEMKAEAEEKKVQKNDEEHLDSSIRKKTGFSSAINKYFSHQNNRQR